MTKQDILKKYFGYPAFRAGQEQLIDNILSGRDVLGIMPTGAGKSLCYQIPALLLPGITLVISPLISLMKDQVQSLNQAGIHAAYINSSLSEIQIAKALQLAAKGQYKIIYVAPERLETYGFLEFAKSAEISMLTVDEAHCISHWGQDFRPSYLKIIQFIHALSKRPILSAFTATATKIVKEDMIQVLGLYNPEVLVTGFDRKNLYFAVEKPVKKDAQLLKYVNLHAGESGIIYCATRKNVEKVYGLLNQAKFPVTRYHAGLGSEERKKNQDDFIYDRKPLIVATNAFGMGIDKSNVRYVIHYNMPQSLENYYQEAGRAGRDGEPGECILYYSGQDVVTNQFFIDNNHENQELDERERRIVRERNMERLKKMTFYCFTNECLRDYILRYFEEYGENYCGNCSNCMTQFETVDVTAIARGLIGCAADSGQRYGVNVIIETVRGANTAKIRQYHMDESPHYAELAKIPAYQLRQVLNELLLHEYLRLTNDDYMLVKLTGKSNQVLLENEPVFMKMAREQEKNTEKEKKTRKGKAADSGIAEQDLELFEALRALRAEIAREEKVPPYIVFSDKTLLHMCAVKPNTRDEMLTVTGVGEFKFEKYGKRFLRCMKEEIGK